MSYYDFEHFWYPEEVCAQKEVPEPENSLVRILRDFFKELFGEGFANRDYD